jgi:hypothetical protein
MKKRKPTQRKDQRENETKNKTEDRFDRQQQSYACSGTFNSNMQGIDNLSQHPHWFHQLPMMHGGQCQTLTNIYFS